MAREYPSPVWRAALPAVAAVLAWTVLSMHGLGPYTHDLLAGAHHGVVQQQVEAGLHDVPAPEHELTHLALCCLVILGGGLFLLRLARGRTDRTLWMFRPQRLIAPFGARAPDPPSLVELSISRT
jgi:hypothetical protein